MPSHRIDRITQDIKREMSDILREIKDPRVSKMLSVVRVEVSGDLSYAKIFVSAVEGYDRTEESAAGLKSAAGFVRRELGSRLRMRKTPELRFVADHSIESAARIGKLLEKQ